MMAVVVVVVEAAVAVEVLGMVEVFLLMALLH